MRSKIVLVLVIALIGVAVIGFADSKRGQGNQGDNNDQGCDRKHPCPDGYECDLDNGECVATCQGNYAPCIGNGQGNCCTVYA